FHRIADDVTGVAERGSEGIHAVANRSGGIYVQRGSEACRQLFKGNLLATERGWRSFLAGGVNESRRPLKKFAQFRFEALPFTLMATTVSSSKVSTPEAWSAAALKMDLTMDSAEFPEHSAMIFSSRVRPKRSPALFVASRMPSLKNTKMSSGSA